MSKKRAIIFALFFAVVSAYVTFSWYYSHSIVVVNRITGLGLPFLSETLYEKDESSWQDAHMAYLFKVSDSYTKMAMTQCDNDGYSVGVFDYTKFSSLIEAGLGIAPSAAQLGVMPSCSKHFSQGDESWDVVLDNGYVLFEYYLYDRP